MTSLIIPVSRFFTDTDLNPSRATQIVTNGLLGSKFGEFYQAMTADEVIAKDKGKFTRISVGNTSSGFGFRAGDGEHVGFCHSNEFSEAKLRKAVNIARGALSGGPSFNLGSYGATSNLMHPSSDPMGGMTLQEKIARINDIESFISNLDSRIINISVSYMGSSEDVHIITADGQSLTDSHPLAMLSMDITLKGQSGRVETGSARIGGRVLCTDVFNKAAYEAAAKSALHEAEELLIAVDAPSGPMNVVMANGWGAIILHESVGHGLEGDFNRRKSGVYHNMIGQQVAARGVTLIDQGDIPGERGSQRMDDEGTLTRQNVLIEDGILKGFMQDRKNASQMGVGLTGNGRRQSFAHAPMPRMTNTFIKAGKNDPQEIIEAAGKAEQKALYAANVTNGQVETASGKFNFNTKLCYEIDGGKLGRPVKGATLIGVGPDMLRDTIMVGNDLNLDKPSGYCGKDGQTVIVSCGQPTLWTRMTVGGSNNPSP